MGAEIATLIRHPITANNTTTTTIAQLTNRDTIARTTIGIAMTTAMANIAIPGIGTVGIIMGMRIVARTEFVAMTILATREITAEPTIAGMPMGSTDNMETVSKIPRSIMDFAME